jgi:excisionase family DNA binding protein
MICSATPAPYRHPPAPEPAAPRLLLRPQEAADALGVSLRSIMAWVKEGAIPTVRLGERNLRLPLDGLRAWVAQRTNWPTSMLVPPGPALSAESSTIPAGANGRDAKGAAKQGTGNGHGGSADA